MAKQRKPKKLHRKKKGDGFDLRAAARANTAAAFGSIVQLATAGKSDTARITAAQYLIEAAGFATDHVDDIIADVAFIEIERRDGKIFELPPLQIVEPADEKKDAEQA